MLGSLRSLSPLSGRISLIRSTPPVFRGALGGIRSYMPSGGETTEVSGEAIEAGKQRAINGQGKSPLKDAPGWEESMATASEADVKADRQADVEDLADLQSDTVKFLNEKQ